MSKRQHQEEPESSATASTKRVKKTDLEKHVQDCEDPECEGCDVGEVEIAILQTDKDGNEQKVEPTAKELLAMALEEAQKKDKNGDIVRRLFDMALDRYQDKEQDDRLGYAICLLQVGRHLSVEESLRESLDVLRAVVRTDENAWIYLAQAAAELLLFLRKRQNTRFEEALAELDEEDEEDQVVREELIGKQKLSREEKKLYKEALDALEKVWSGERNKCLEAY